MLVISFFFDQIKIQHFYITLFFNLIVHQFKGHLHFINSQVFFIKVFTTSVLYKKFNFRLFQSRISLRGNKRTIIVFSHILNRKRICTYEINFVLKSKCCLLIICQSIVSSKLGWQVVAIAGNSFSCLCSSSWLVQEMWADHRQGAVTAATFEVVPLPNSLDSSASFVDDTTPASSPAGSCSIGHAAL